MTTLFIDGEPEYFADGPPGAFVPLAEVDALEAQIAAYILSLEGYILSLEGLAAELDGLRAALQQTQDERGRLRDALTDMLYIFDRGLPEDSIGRMRCDQARDALNLTAT